MSPTEFVYWLQGYMELENPKTLNAIQTQIIKDHLAQVFIKKTPDHRTMRSPLKCNSNPKIC